MTEMHMHYGTPASRRLTPSAFRMRKVQERLKRGVRCVTIEIDAAQIAALIARGLPQDQADAFLAPASRRKDRTLSDIARAQAVKKTAAAHVANAIQSVLASALAEAPGYRK